MIILALFIAFLSSVSSIINKLLGFTFCNETIILISGIINLILLIIFSYFKKEKIINDLEMDKFTPSVLLLFLITTIGCSLISTITYNYIINLHPPHRISTMLSVTPVFTMILSYYILETNITKHSIIGTLIVLIGIFIIILETSNNKSNEIIDEFKKN